MKITIRNQQISGTPALPEYLIECIETMAMAADLEDAIIVGEKDGHHFVIDAIIETNFPNIFKRWSYERVDALLDAMEYPEYLIARESDDE